MQRKLFNIIVRRDGTGWVALMKQHNGEETVLKHSHLLVNMKRAGYLTASEYAKLRTQHGLR